MGQAVRQHANANTHLHALEANQYLVLRTQDYHTYHTPWNMGRHRTKDINVGVGVGVG